MPRVYTGISSVCILSMYTTCVYEMIRVYLYIQVNRHKCIYSRGPQFEPVAINNTLFFTYSTAYVIESNTEASVCVQYIGKPRGKVSILECVIL